MRILSHEKKTIHYFVYRKHSEQQVLKEGYFWLCSLQPEHFRQNNLSGWLVTIIIFASSKLSDKHSDNQQIKHCYTFLEDTISILMSAYTP